MIRVAQLDLGSRQPQPNASPVLELRGRLLHAIGLTGLMALTACSGSTGAVPGTRLTDIVSGVLADADASCPENPFYAPDAFSILVAAHCDTSVLDDSFGYAYTAYTEILNVDFVRQIGEECHYELSCAVTYSAFDGRPIEVDGEPLIAPSHARSDWAGALAPSVDELDTTERQLLAEYWARCGAEEHSSIAGFQRFALELMAHGAPPRLVDAAMQAGRDEVGHTQEAFGLASAYAGQSLGPGQLPLGTEVKLATTLVELAVTTARQGAIGESFAAFIASERLKCATDPAVRLVLQRIVEEETRHAELAWATLDWALQVGGEPVREALETVFAELSVSPSRAPAVALGLAAHGVAGPLERRRAMEECARRVLAPTAKLLLHPERLAA